MIVKVTSKKKLPPNFRKYIEEEEGSCWLCEHSPAGTKKCLKYDFPLSREERDHYICDNWILGS